MPLSASSIRVVPAANQVVPGVGKYRYIAMLAEGGMADVYLAVTQSAGFEKLVVIKQLRDALAQDPSFVAMFMDEARLAARLNHPNVVQTLEVGTDPLTGHHFIAMEFLEGVAHVRFARLKERVPAPLSFHLRILIDVLRGLHYAHELRDFDGRPLNVVHRDVSPQNVMLTFAGGVKVLDFGIAKAALAAEKRPEDFKGKLEYMAPEQARMESVDRRADIFSVGVMLFEALTRRRLFRKGDEKLELLTTGRLPNVQDVTDGIPKKLGAICSKAMAHDRTARYATADAMADELEDWLLSTVQHVTARDVGACVAEKFASTREKISAAIEGQLALIHAMAANAPHTVPLTQIPSHFPPADLSQPPVGYTIPPPGSMPPVQVPHLLPAGFSTSRNSSVPSGYAWGVGRDPHSGEVGIGSGEFGAQGPSLGGSATPLSPLSSGFSSPPPGFSTQGSAVPGAPLLADKRPRSRAKTMLVVAIVAIFGLVSVGGSVVVVLRTRHASHAKTTTIAPAVPAPLTASGSATVGETPAEAQIDFTIKASPPEARIFLDDKPLGSNPATGQRPRDGAMHRLRIEAPGHDPREEQIAFDRSIFINVELRASASTWEAPASTGTSRRNPRGGRTPRAHTP